jgi:hypothetical protein
MGDTPPDSGKRPLAHARAQPRSAAPRRRQERRRALIVGCGVLMVAAATTAVMIVMSGHSSRAPQVALAAPDGDLHTTKITKDLGGKECAQDIFDNQTGRMTRSTRPCDATAYDSNGAPIPLGTIHRLDAINKSFSGR